MDILIPILTLSGLGIFFGAGLAFAAKRFCTVADPRLEKIYARLPGANCGACGMAGCMGFAEGLIQGTCTIEACRVTEEEDRREIAGILGLELKTKTKKVAVLHCQGARSRVKDKFVYSGIRDCIAANLVMQGPKACVYGCIGFGTCVQVCPFGAISMNEEEGLPIVDEGKCTACGKCVAACPKNLFSLEPVNKIYTVGCRSQELGKEVMQVCSVGCIACGKCQNVCPTGAIKVIDGSTSSLDSARDDPELVEGPLTINPEGSRRVDNLAIIDYNICDNRGECFRVCPTKAITRRK